MTTYIPNNVVNSGDAVELAASTEPLIADIAAAEQEEIRRRQEYESQQAQQQALAQQAAAAGPAATAESVIPPLEQLTPWEQRTEHVPSGPPVRVWLRRRSTELGGGGAAMQERRN